MDKGVEMNATLNFIGQAFFWIWLTVPYGLFLLLVIIRRQVTLSYRMAGSFLIGASGWIISNEIWTALAFKDGLGSDSIQSNGVESAKKAFEHVDFSMLILAVACLALGIFFLRAQAKEKSSNK